MSDKTATETLAKYQPSIAEVRIQQLEADKAMLMAVVENAIKCIEENYTVDTAYWKSVLEKVKK